MSTSLPPVKRFVTGHDSKGKAVVVKEDVPKALEVPTGADRKLITLFHYWSSETFPFDNTDESDLSLLEDGKTLTREGGMVLYVPVISRLSCLAGC